jgi:hypothetical protein
MSHGRLRITRAAAHTLICALALSVACSEPPQKEIDRAQGAIDAARAAGADQYATEAYNAATSALQQAHDAVQQRDYRLALSRALDANERALEAAKESANGKARARGESEGLLAATATSIHQLQTKLKAAETARVPAAQLESGRRLRSDADRVLQEARAAVKEGNYLVAMKRTQQLQLEINAQIKAIDDAIESRTSRTKRRPR